MELNISWLCFKTIIFQDTKFDISSKAKKISVLLKGKDLTLVIIMKETMTSRERVHAALNFQIPDRVPLDLGGFQTGIHKKA